VVVVVVVAVVLVCGLAVADGTTSTDPDALAPEAAFVTVTS
jgi:hypothetical protein